MYFNKDTRYGAEGYWYCAVKSRERSQDHYDHDFVYRNEKLMKHSRRKRLETIVRQKESLGSGQV